MELKIKLYLIIIFINFIKNQITYKNSIHLNLDISSKEIKNTNNKNFFSNLEKLNVNYNAISITSTLLHNFYVYGKWSPIPFYAKFMIYSDNFLNGQVCYTNNTDILKKDVKDILLKMFDLKDFALIENAYSYENNLYSCYNIYIKTSIYDIKYPRTMIYLLQFAENNQVHFDLKNSYFHLESQLKSLLKSNYDQKYCQSMTNIYFFKDLGRTRHNDIVIKYLPKDKYSFNTLIDKLKEIILKKNSDIDFLYIHFDTDNKYLKINVSDLINNSLEDNTLKLKENIKYKMYDEFTNYYNVNDKSLNYIGNLATNKNYIKSSVYINVNYSKAFHNEFEVKIIHKDNKKNIMSLFLILNKNMYIEKHELNNSLNAQGILIKELKYSCNIDQESSSDKTPQYYVYLVINIENCYSNSLNEHAFKIPFHIRYQPAKSGDYTSTSIIYPIVNLNIKSYFKIHQYQIDGNEILYELNSRIKALNIKDLQTTIDIPNGNTDNIIFVLLTTILVTFAGFFMIIIEILKNKLYLLK